jgi:hypothetical protein
MPRRPVEKCSCIFSICAIHGEQMAGRGAGQEPKCLGGHGWPREAAGRVLSLAKKNPRCFAHRGFCLLQKVKLFQSNGISNNATMLMILISGFTAGPAVSL